MQGFRSGIWPLLLEGLVMVPFVPFEPIESENSFPAGYYMSSQSTGYLCTQRCPVGQVDS